MNKENQRIFGLDILRAIAISMVLISHTNYFFEEYDNLFIDGLQLLGVQGVEVFFILSGFLIGGILLKIFQSQMLSYHQIVHFWIRRWFRTLPLYFLVLIVNIFVAFVVGLELHPQLWKYFLFLQNFSYYDNTFFPESWSLSVEEYAYLLAPIFIVVFYKACKINSNSKYRGKAFVFASCLLVLIFWFNKVWYYFSTIEQSQTVGLWNSNLKAIVVYRLDAIFIGFVLIYYFNEHTTLIKKFKNKLALVGVLLSSLILAILPLVGVSIENYPFYWNVIYLPLNSIAICLILPYFYFLKSPKSFLKNGIERVSLYSYSMYLLHYTFLLYLMRLCIEFKLLNIFERLLCVIFYFVIIYYLSKLVYHCYEKPMTDIRSSKFIRDKFIK